MAFTCGFSNGFSNGFAICVAEPVIPTDPNPLYGVPVLPTRRRPAVREIAGVGYVSVLGAGRLTAEACLASTLLQPNEGTGQLDADGLRLIVGVIRAGAESLLRGERSATASAGIAIVGGAAACGEQATAGVLAQMIHGAARMVNQCEAAGRMPIRSGAEAVLAPQENEEPIILMAAEIVRRRLTT